MILIGENRRTLSTTNLTRTRVSGVRGWRLVACAMARPRLSGYIRSQNSSGNPHAVYESPVYSKIGVWCAVSRRRIVDHRFLGTQCGNCIRMFWPTHLSSEDMKEISGFNMVGRRPKLQAQMLYCKSTFVSALLGFAFGHRDLQTSPRQDSFCGDFSKKELITITHETWRYWNAMLNRPLQSFRNTSQSLTKHIKIGGCVSSRRWWKLSAAAVKLFCKFFLAN
jgi:hypothetical protein